VKVVFGVRVRYRVMTVGAIAGLAVLGLAGPALAHVEVSADKTTAGAQNVTLTFNGEAESGTAGIASERVVLPQGIDPASVTLVKAPAGWTFAANADGFTVGGKALKIGVDAVWKVKIAKLPDGQTRLSFKTLETYGDGKVARWSEIQEPGQDEPDNPAPLVTLKPGPSTAPTTAAPTSEAPSPVITESSAAPVATRNTAATPAADQGGSTWWIWLVVAGVVVIGAVLLLLRRKRPADSAG
jgi:hypothetical protein